MIYELRIYTAQPGRLRDLLARFETHTNRIWARYGIRQVGFWTTIVGPTDGLTYLLAWESFAEREEKWTAFRADPELIEVFAESEKTGRWSSTSRTSCCTPPASRGSLDGDRWQPGPPMRRAGQHRLQSQVRARA
jgi:hypothetical protein